MTFKKEDMSEQEFKHLTPSELAEAYIKQLNFSSFQNHLEILIKAAFLTGHGAGYIQGLEDGRALEEAAVKFGNA